MAPTTAPAPPTPPTTPPPPFGPDSRRFRRSVDDRYAGGVAGGLARQLDVDANLVRLALLVMGIFSLGFVAVAYGAAWLLVPDTADDEPIGLRWYREHAPGPGRPFATIAMLLVGAVLASAAFAIATDGDEGAGTVLVFLAIAGIGLATHRKRHGAGPRRPGPHGGRPGPDAPPPPPGDGPSTTDDATAVMGDEPTAVVRWSEEAPTGGPAATDGDEPAGSTRPIADPHAAARRRSRRIARNVAILAATEAAVVTGALWVTETGPLPGWVVPASALGVLLVGLAGAPVWGWSWSVAVLAVLAVPFVLLAAVPGVSLRGGVGYRSDHPTAVADLPARYRLGLGHQELDLTDLDLVPGTTTVVRVGVGVGEASVTVPDDVDLVLRGHLGGGAVFVDDAEAGIEGGDVDIRRTYPATGTAERTSTGRIERDRTDVPKLVIDAEIGAGALTIDRVAA